MLGDSAAIKGLKQEILTACYHTGEGHVASAYSILDILYVLYDRVLDCGMIKKNSETAEGLRQTA